MKARFCPEGPSLTSGHCYSVCPLDYMPQELADAVATKGFFDAYGQAYDPGPNEEYSQCGMGVYHNVLGKARGGGG